MGTADPKEVSKAFAVLENALDRCRDENMRTDEVVGALAYLGRLTPHHHPFTQMYKSLDMKENEEARWQNVNASVNALKREVAAVLLQPHPWRAFEEKVGNTFAELSAESHDFIFEFHDLDASPSLYSMLNESPKLTFTITKRRGRNATSTAKIAVKFDPATDTVKIGYSWRKGGPVRVIQLEREKSGIFKPFPGMDEVIKQLVRDLDRIDPEAT